MTRENKVALVVGFALVLLAGVLISDHFSKARLDRPANLAVHQAAGMSLAPAKGELIDLSPYFQVDNAPASAPAPGPELGFAPASGADERPRLPAEPPLAPAPAFQSPAAPATSPTASAPASPPPAAARLLPPSAQPKSHEVQPGESLSVICDRYYHDQALLDEFARFNNISDLDDVRAGQRLRLPSAAELSGKAPATAAPPPAATQAKADAKTCTVQPGETLMQIAARHLGSRSRWRELFEANRDVIDDPDSVEAGTVLKLPSPKR